MSRSAGAAEIDFGDFRIGGDLAGWAGQRDGAELHHIGGVGHRKGGAGVLLDEQDRHAGVAQSADRLQDVAHDQRCQAEAWFVEHQHARVGHQRAAHGQHLPLAAGQRARLLAAAFLQAREQRENFLQPGRDLGAAAPEGAKLEILADGHGGEQVALFGHQGDAESDPVLGRHVGEVGAVEGDAPARRQQPHDGGEQRRLAGAVGADHRGDRAGFDRQGDPLDGLHLAIGDVEVGDVEKRAHRSAPR